MPGLKVLDQHAITDLERRKAKALIAGDIAILTVAFGKRVPAYDPQMHEKVSETSELEQDLARVRFQSFAMYMLMSTRSGVACGHLGHGCYQLGWV